MQNDPKINKLLFNKLFPWATIKTSMHLMEKAATNDLATIDARIYQDECLREYQRPQLPGGINTIGVNYNLIAKFLEGSFDPDKNYSTDISAELEDLFYLFIKANAYYITECVEYRSYGDPRSIRCLHDTKEYNHFYNSNHSRPDFWGEKFESEEQVMKCWNETQGLEDIEELNQIFNLYLRNSQIAYIKMFNQNVFGYKTVKEKEEIVLSKRRKNHNL